MIQKLSLNKLIRDGDVSGPRIEGISTRAELNAMVNESVHHAFVNQSKVLRNSIDNLIK